MLVTNARLRLVAWPVLFIFLVATMIAFAGSADASARQRRERKIDHAVQVARNQIGDPYVYGAAGPGAFDCSGLTMFAYARAGMSLPRSSDAQARAVRRIKRSNLRRGDLIFFHSGGNVYHVGIFMKRKDGRRIILHSSYSGRPVQRDPIWDNNWFAGTLRPRR